MLLKNVRLGATSAATIGICAMMSFASAVGAAIINFDVFPNGQAVRDRTVITTQYASLGVLFSSSAPAGGPTAAYFFGEASSQPNALWGIEANAGLREIVMDFPSPPTASMSVSLNVLSVGCGTVHATAFASDLITVVDAISLTRGFGGGNGYGNIDPITLSGTGIAQIYIWIEQTGEVVDGFGIDDVEITFQCLVDFDGDGFVTGLDFDLFVQAFEAGEATSDFDGDGFITGVDFDLFVQAFEYGC